MLVIHTMSVPQSVIHINFMVGQILFDARPIWTSLRQAEAAGKLRANAANDISAQFGNTALHIATRHSLIRLAIRELNKSLKSLYELLPDPSQIKPHLGFRVVNGKGIDEARDQVLLYTDSCLFELRSFLELLAHFAYGILNGIGKAPADQELLSSGKKLTIIKKKKLQSHDFLLYLCDKLNIATTWYEFLQTHRNFFTHKGAPYCVIEDLSPSEPHFALIIIRTNIHDFKTADPKDYFRISELQDVIKGIIQLAAATQNYLINTIKT